MDTQNAQEVTPQTQAARNLYAALKARNRCDVLVGDMKLNAESALIKYASDMCSAEFLISAADNYKFALQTYRISQQTVELTRRRCLDLGVKPY